MIVYLWLEGWDRLVVELYCQLKIECLIWDMRKGDKIYYAW